MLPWNKEVAWFPADNTFKGEPYEVSTRGALKKQLAAAAEMGLGPQASARTGVPVLPAPRYTTSQGHTTKWPGTFSLRHETLISTLRDIAAWAHASGWKRLLLVNAHFGNDGPARVAVDQLRLSYLGNPDKRPLASILQVIWSKSFGMKK